MTCRPHEALARHRPATGLLGVASQLAGLLLRCLRELLAELHVVLLPPVLLRAHGEGEVASDAPLDLQGRLGSAPGEPAAVLEQRAAPGQGDVAAVPPGTRLPVGLRAK